MNLYQEIRCQPKYIVKLKQEWITRNWVYSEITKELQLQKHRLGASYSESTEGLRQTVIKGKEYKNQGGPARVQAVSSLP